MYTFQNIFLSLKGRTVGVKWEASWIQTGWETPEEKLNTGARLQLEELDRVVPWNDHLVISRSLNALRKTVEKISVDNGAKTAFLFQQIDRAISETTGGDQLKLQKLKKEWESDLKVAQSVLAEKKKTVVSLTAKELDILSASDPDVKKLIDGYMGNIVLPKELGSAIARAVTYTGWGWKKVYENVVGVIPGDTLDAQKFQKALDQSVRLLQQFGGGNAGLEALLQWKTEIYFSEIQKRIINWEKITINLKSIDTSAFSPRTQTLLGALATVVVGYGTGGLVIVGHEASTVTSDAFVKEFQEDKKWGFWNGLGNGLKWLKEAAMWRRASITLGANDREWNVEQYHEDIRSYTKAVMEWKYDAHPVLKELYPSARQMADKAGVKTDSDQFKKALIQSYILNEGFARKWVDWKANIGLFFMGAGREEVKATVLSTTESEYGSLERAVIKSSISEEVLKKAWFSEIIKTDGDWTHTIPDTLQLAGDLSPLPVVIAGQTASNGKYTISHSNVQTFHLSLKNGKYELILTDAATQPPAWVKRASPSADIPQGIKEVVKIRETSERQVFASMLYYVGHADPKIWGTFLRELGGMNYESAKAELERIRDTTKFKTLAKNLLMSFDDIAKTWTTYTYANRVDIGKEEFTQKDVNRVRTNKVIKAEKTLAQSVGISESTDDAEFVSDDGYKSKQVSELFPGQEMTLSVFATPKTGDGKTWSHRIDSMDGSFAVHEKIVPVAWDYKNQIIDATSGLIKNEKKAILGQVGKLNEFLRANKITQEVSPENYIKYLKSDNIANLWVPWLMLQPGKGTKVFEARAMIAGNICMNRTHGIIYPLFQLQWKEGEIIPQKANPAASLDYTTPTTVSSVEARQSALGLSTLALIAKLIPDRKASNTTIKTEPGETRVVTTKPGEASQIFVNNQQVWVINTNGTITTSAGTFRLAPGQTMDQFLGSQWLMKDITITTVTSSTSMSPVAYVLKNLSGAEIIFIAAESIREIN